MRMRLVHSCSSALIVCGLTISGLAAPAEPINYDRDVRPILSENCFPCHGQDSKKRMAGLRLDTFEDATADRGGRSALVPGKPEASVLYQRISAESPQRRMPPISANRKLAPEQVALIKHWIEDAGVYNRHWAFIPPTRPAIPEIADRSWVKQPIDTFVYQRLQRAGLKPNRAAAAETWLRRVSLDLTGLPPTLSELDDFAKAVQARGEPAYASAVDRLLASARYGERMAQDWLDVARYADTHGFNNDATRSMWRWRDWVIQSFNHNMPYNQFITEQLAGDLLPNPTLDQRIATGFGRNHVINSEGGIIEEEYRISYVTDRVRTLGMAWLGLTLDCAHCHDHKFDPITQRDHYGFFAFFNNVPEAGEDGRVSNAVPMIPAPTADQQRKLQRLDSEIARLKPVIERREKQWSWRAESGDPHLQQAAKNGTPSGAALQLHCESASEFETAMAPPLASGGIAGNACMAGAPDSKPQTGKRVPVARRQPLTFAFWLRPESDAADAALFSTMDYTITTASSSYGKGLDLRLAGDEIEFRWADRFPAYSIQVRSIGAGILPGQWRHVALVYSGTTDKEAMRAEASWIRMFVDGRELPARVLHDGLGLPDEGEKPSLTSFRIGWDSSASRSRFSGQLDEIGFWPRAFSASEISSAFESHAIPHAVQQAHQGKASTTEITWLRSASLRSSDAQFAEGRKRLDNLYAERLALQRSLPTVMVMEEMPQPRQTRILFHGMYDAPGEEVKAGVPEQLLGAWPAGAPKNRLGLAQWLTKPDHPLTARVVVNRFWQQLFGQGLVKTSDNFGMQGEWPSHPELLDWLAREFIDSGWNVKALMKRMVLSSTYRQDSTATPELVARDPENRLLAHGPRFRLSAEAIRDQALQIAGLLHEQIGGPSVYPYQPEDLYKSIVVAANIPGVKYTQSTGTDLYRRSLYTFWKRTVPHPSMVVFDSPDREFCVVQRSVTDTPLQALTLLNDPTFVEAARKLAERVIRQGGTDPDARLAFAFRLATARTPDPAEKQILRAKLDQMLVEYRRDPAAANSLASAGASRRDPAIPVAELAAYTAVANMILNLDEVITRG